ncbi:MAG: DUF3108 domain-containing protein [Gammaproteobacteria bacterium]
MRLISAAMLATGMALATPGYAAPVPATARTTIPATVPSTTRAAVSATANTMARLPARLNVTPFEMRYRVLRDGWHLGNATFTLKPAEDGTWLFESKASASGLASLFVHSTFGESSHFTLHDHQLQPLSYTYTDSGSPSHNESINFNWTTGQALDTKGDKTAQIALDPGILDRLTLQLALSRQLAAGLPLRADWTAINGGELKHYHLVRKGKDVLATPAGDFDTVIVVRGTPKSKRTTIFWFAPKYEWLPVKMQQRQTGKATITFVLNKLTWIQK